MSIRRSSWAAVAALGFVVAFALAPGSAKSAENEDIGTEGDVGLAVAAGVASVVYAPAKILYAAGGGLVAGLAYVFSAGDKAITEPILTPSLRGDYYVTPSQLRGERPLEFIGRAPAETGDETEHVDADPAGDGLDFAPPVSSAASEPQ